jgi:uncharacterized protein (DUF1800 family)
MRALQPYRGPWDNSRAAHLLNRATFGATPVEISRATAAGLQKTVDALMAFQPEGKEFPAPETPEIPERPRLALEKLPPEERRKKIQEFTRANRDSIEEVRAWWIKRMLRSQYPLREKLVLFWHGHFTSSANDVKAARFMLRQNQFLRHNCLADFRTLLVGISQDPAMLRYLDNNTNRKKHPNENYARELMELFTMGIGNYTEDDVKAAARAFTGWSYRADGFVFEKFTHDYGEKTFLGHTGNLDGTDIIDIILQQPCTARFLATKFLKFFVTDPPAPAAVDEAASILRGDRYEFKPMLRAIFLSDYFFSTEAYRTQIKSPAQLVVGASRQLGVTIDERALAVAMRGLGQDLFYPPNVKGWDGGDAWINTTTLLMRYNFAGYLLGGEIPGASAPPPKGPARRFRLERFPRPKTELNTLIRPELAGDPPKLVDELIVRLLQTKLADQLRQWLIEQAQATRLRERTTVVAHLIMSMPEYQLC